MKNIEDVIISVQNVSKEFVVPTEKKGSLKQHLITFGGRQKNKKFGALNDITFDVCRGEFFGIIGRNGSGKSTMLKLLAGIYQPTKGRIKVNGNLTPFIELGIGFNPELTGKENVFLNGAILGLSEKEVIAHYDEIVKFAELKKFMNMKLKNYSSGMQVRLAFSIAMQARNDILLIDEVLAVGDVNFQRKCFEEFRKIKKNGKTVIFVTHDMQSVMEFCTRAMLISDSRVVEIGDPEDIAEAYLRLNNDNSNTEDASNTGKRWGNKKATINYIKIGAVSKDTITITAECEYKKDVESPVVGFSIKDPLGHKVVESNTLWNKVVLDDYKSGTKLNVTWEVANIFTNGRHTVTMALAGSSGTEFFDWWEDAGSFIINKNIPTSASTLPKQEINVKVSK
ncbi:ABC transporter ATP-binding protein [Candidatus Saccharibacteria bacterium]|nr:ABC transporter ATP-binding protein [Candidatus Saccharibacteria bacterium]